jgi:hypothetical protein
MKNLNAGGMRLMLMSLDEIDSEKFINDVGSIIKQWWDDRITADDAAEQIRCLLVRED